MNDKKKKVSKVSRIPFPRAHAEYSIEQKFVIGVGIAAILLMAISLSFFLSSSITGAVAGIDSQYNLGIVSDNKGSYTIVGHLGDKKAAGVYLELESKTPGVNVCTLVGGNLGSDVTNHLWNQFYQTSCPGTVFSFGDATLDIDQAMGPDFNIATFKPVPAPIVDVDLEFRRIDIYDSEGRDLFAGGGTISISPPGEPPPAACNDNVQNGDEEGIDCGGTDCEACPVSGCAGGAANGAVDAGETCANCPADVQCGAGTACNVDAGVCALVGGACGDKAVNLGETCASCPADVSCGAGVCYEEKCQIDTCVDTDPVNNLSIAGSVTHNYSLSQDVRYVDWCANSTSVWNVFCGGGNATLQSCPVGTSCQAGACVSPVGVQQVPPPPVVSGGPSRGGGGGCDSNWQCSDWSFCNNQKKQTRSCSDVAGCTVKPKIETRDCAACQESWICSAWSSCSSGQQYRTCNDEHACGITTGKPALQKGCNALDPNPGVRTSSSIQPPYAPPAYTPPRQPVTQQPIKGFMGQLWEEYGTLLVAVPSGLTVLIVVVILGVHALRRKKKVFNIDELKNWIKMEEAAGTSIPDIKDILADHTGWRKEDIEEAFEELREEDVEKSSSPPSAEGTAPLTVS